MNGWLRLLVSLGTAFVVANGNQPQRVTSSGQFGSWAACQVPVCNQVRKQAEGLTRLKLLRNYVVQTMQLMDSLVTSLDEELVKTGQGLSDFVGDRCPGAHLLLQHVNKPHVDADHVNNVDLRADLETSESSRIDDSYEEQDQNQRWDNVSEHTSDNEIEHSSGIKRGRSESFGSSDTWGTTEQSQTNKNTGKQLVKPPGHRDEYVAPSQPGGRGVGQGGTGSGFGGGNYGQGGTGSGFGGGSEGSGFGGGSSGSGGTGSGFGGGSSGSGGGNYRPGGSGGTGSGFGGGNNRPGGSGGTGSGFGGGNNRPGGSGGTGSGFGGGNNRPGGSGGTGSGFGGGDYGQGGTGSGFGGGSSGSGGTGSGFGGGDYGQGGTGSGVGGGNQGSGGTGGGWGGGSTGGCRGVDKSSPFWVPGLDSWCVTNCAAGYCPSTHCVC